MGLNTALVDRGRRVFNERVSGGTTAEVRGAWFKCRLAASAGTGATDPTKEQQDQTFALLVGSTDSDGQPVGILATDRIEVVSAELGTETFQVQGPPKAIRRKRSIMGWRLNLQRRLARERGFS